MTGLKSFRPLSVALAPYRRLIVGVPAVAAALALALLLTGANRSLFLVLNGLSRYTGDAFWSLVTVLGDGYLSALFLLPLALRRPDVLRAALPGMVLITLGSLSIKEALEVSRPLAVLDASLVHVIGPAHRSNSMPSGHTVWVFFLASLFLPLYGRRWQAWLLVALATLVAVSRVACGVHWPADAAVGALLGWAGGLAGWWLGERWPAGLGPWVQHGFVLVLAALGLYVLVGYHSAHPDAEWLKTLIAAASLAAVGWNYATFYRRRRGAGA